MKLFAAKSRGKKGVPCATVALDRAEVAVMVDAVAAAGAIPATPNTAVTIRMTALRVSAPKFGPAVTPVCPAPPGGSWIHLSRGAIVKTCMLVFRKEGDLALSSPVMCIDACRMEGFHLNLWCRPETTWSGKLTDVRYLGAKNLNQGVRVYCCRHTVRSSTN